MNLDLKTLVGKLNPTCRKALETAASFCASQTHYNVEIEHYLLKLIEQQDTDITRLLRYYEVKEQDVVRDLTLSMETFKRGNSRNPALSEHIQKLLQEAWMVSSLHMGSNVIRSGSVLVALYENDALRRMMAEACLPLAKISRDRLKNDIKDIIRGSSEDTQKQTDATGGTTTASGSQQEDDSPASTTALAQYTVDLTAEARAGKIDPIQGRDTEIRQIIDILTRRRQNNPILTGEAGVGKTAVVEGFALRVVAGDVPPPLKNISVRTLDLGLLQAGASIKGEFENRLKNVINEVKKSPTPIILFIDEAHTMIGAGGQAGQNDAANLLKPALARGELRTIAATTWAEYKKYFEKDPALARRFQVIKVEEPSEAAAVLMLRGVVETLERHHKVRILDEAVRDAVGLSHRYISGRQLPDKAISVLDTACARVAIGQNDTPPVIEDVVRRIQQIEIEIPILNRELLAGEDHKERITSLADEIEELKDKKVEYEARWKTELGLVAEYNQIHNELEEFAAERDMDNLRGEDLQTLMLLNTEIDRLKKELARIQGNEPMVPVCVDSIVIADVISGWTGIPVGKMLSDEIRTILSLKEKMAERVVGQQHALEAIARRIQTSRADLTDPGKPMGVFLLVGPSGVGKTETAVTLAEILFGGERNMVSVNMSEYQEAHTVSSLKGAPPGYVGYGTGGVLTEAVRRNPYSVVLLDEIEKAHPDVMELFYQVFDKGMLEDGEGVVVNFRNTIILLTSNVGTETIMGVCQDPNDLPDADTLVECLRPELVNVFKPALLGRMVVAPYYPLTDDIMRDIVRLKLGKIQARFVENHNATLTYDDAVIAAISARCTEADSGARAVDNILTNTLLPQLSNEVLERMVDGSMFVSVHIGVDDGGVFHYTFDGDDGRVQKRVFSMS
jgi:type VI secretion system protein VasG